MATISKQIQGGLKGAGKAVTVDVAKGVSEAGKQVVEDTLSTGVEKLSGGVVSGNQQQTQQNESVDPELAVMKAKKSQAARKRLQEVQGELRQVVEQEKAKKEQVAQVEERQQEQEQVQEEESKAVRMKKWLMQKAKRGGGTGETARTKN